MSILNRVLVVGMITCLAIAIPACAQAETWADLVERQWKEEQVLKSSDQASDPMTWLKYDLKWQLEKSQVMAKNGKTNEIKAEFTKLGPPSQSSWGAAVEELSNIEKNSGKDGEPYQEAQKMMDATKAKMEALIGQAGASAEAEVTNAKAPTDTYKGNDKNKLKLMIKEAWQKAYPDEKIVGIRFAKTDWVRKKTKDWVSDHWEYNDMSFLAINVAVKDTADPKTTIVYTAIMNKNNNGGALSAGVYTKNDYVSYKMLTANFK